MNILYRKMYPCLKTEMLIIDVYMTMFVLEIGSPVKDVRGYIHSF